ncbi:SPRY domain-containing SOCS box protein 3a isoform X2 [Osmerus mordax]
MSRRSRNSRAWRYVWSGIRRDADARALGLASETEDWRYERLQYSDSDSEADFPSVVVPAVPSAVPVTGESYCGCDSLTESSCTPCRRGLHRLRDCRVRDCPCGEDDQGEGLTAPVERMTRVRVRDCRCGEDDQDFDWVWDDSSRSTATLLSCDNRKVNFHTEYSCGTAAIRGARELAEGQHFWEIKMTSPVYGTDMMVGIGTSDVNLDKYRHSFCSLLGKDEDSWGLSYTGLLHHKGDKVNFSSRFGQGSIIGVHLDTWHGTLTFFKNRKCIGVAATELQNKRLFPMACSTAAKSSMKVIRSCFAPTSLQYLCCARLRQLLPDCTDTLSVLPLPPGLRHLLHTKLGWVLSLNGCGSEEGADGPERPAASPPGTPAASPPGTPAACRSLCDSEGCCSNPEAYQRKRCRWT